MFDLAKLKFNVTDIGESSCIN